MEISIDSEKQKGMKISDSMQSTEKSNENQSDSQSQSDQSKTINSSNKKKQKIQLNDFMYQTNLGKGAYGEVILMKKVNSGTLYAVKIIDKQFLLREKKEYQVQIEREILIKLDSPFMTKLNYTFQDQNKLYFVMEYFKGGEFSKFIKKNSVDFGVLTQEWNSPLRPESNINHQWKPENLMLDQNNHLKIIDFGTALFMNNTVVSNEFLKRINKMRQNEHATEEQMIEQYQSKHKCTFVGTAEYVSPELLNDEECGYGADIWALGCIMYKMYSSKTPFWDQTEYLVFQNIKQGRYQQPDNMEDEAYTLIQGMLKIDQKERLTIEQIKQHPYFRTINWNTLYQQPAPRLTARSLKIDTSSVIHKGVVLKRCGWVFYKPRLLIIDNLKQITYYDTINNQQKGIIRLNKQCHAILDNDQKWTLQIPGRKYYFKFYEQNCQDWVNIVNKVIKDCIE